jgi:hypothetical protein
MFSFKGSSEKLNVWSSPDGRENPPLLGGDWNDSGRNLVLNGWISAPNYCDYLNVL